MKKSSGKWAKALATDKMSPAQKQHLLPYSFPFLTLPVLTSKDARGQGFRGRLVPILLTTLRAAPCGLFCQIGIVWRERWTTPKPQSESNDCFLPAFLWK